MLHVTNYSNRNVAVVVAKRQMYIRNDINSSTKDNVHVLLSILSILLFHICTTAN